MAEKVNTKDRTDKTINENTPITFEPVKQIETDTLNIIKSLKTFLFIVMGLLAYLIFMIIPEIDSNIIIIEKQLSTILTQSERYKASTRVFSKNNVCAECHLDPDHLLHNLGTKYPSFADLKSFMSVGHKRYYSSQQPYPDEELMNVYRLLQ